MRERFIPETTEREKKKNIFEDPEWRKFRADYLLKSLGLEYEDLRDKQVLDVGAGPRFVEREADKRDIRVHSLDRSREAIMFPPKLEGGIVADAEALPIKEKSIDVVISAGAAPPFSRSEKETIAYMNEIERTLSDEGEARIAAKPYPFIAEKIIPERLHGPVKFLSVEERDELETLKQKAQQESFEFLQNEGYHIESQQAEFTMSDPTQKKEQDYSKEYWILRKRKKK
ncbi:class I SAM-dependent methyltransferase [Patescibacteria group bacterium]